jgi:poly-gamma-glutamate capsule biosynthesis protein CapA/YwtB (metallophosphatase superfamily)
MIARERMSDQNIVIAVVGDIILDREDPNSMFRFTAPLLREADITFGNCEAPYSEKGSRNPGGRGTLMKHPRNVPAFKAAGFDVMSFAHNHVLDYGYEAFGRTLELLRANDIAVCGAGNDLDEARKPVIMERNGVRVAFLAYASVFFMGYEAGDGKPGLAPLHVYTQYVQEEDEQPGTEPLIFTFTDRSDLLAMQEDVRRARNRADVVVLMNHMGLHFVRAKLADYEGEIARAAIDAGADVVIGVHAHILKGIDSYRGKLIFHNIGNFAIEVPSLEAVKTPRLQKMFDRYSEFFDFNDPEYRLYPFSHDARKTVIVKLVADGSGVKDVRIVPCYVAPDAAPMMLKPDDPRFREVAEYLEAVTREAGLNSRLEPGELDYRVVATR